MLTGDENIVDVNFVVFWRIKDAGRYLFNIEKPEITVRDVAESAMRDIVGQSNIQPLLTGARQKTEEAVQKLIQRVLDSYGAGVSIDQSPPSATYRRRAPTRSVYRTRRERTHNRIVPEARGEAERILQEARAYKEQVVAEAIRRLASSRSTRNTRRLRK